jgi:poly(3-hydroxybutyrate) depolymerase
VKQIEATPARPFYSVSYCYAQNHSTSWGFNRYFEVTGDKAKNTMSGTDSIDLAKRAAEHLIKQTGIDEAQIHVTTDCYNHKHVLTLKS